MYQFEKALWDVGESINLMPLSYSKIAFHGDKSIKKPIKMLYHIYDILIKVYKLIFLVDFIILYCEMNFEVSTI